MDPASILALVAACASLVKSSASVVKSLHDIASSYKDAGLDILSLEEVCETTRFAWTRLEEWAAQNPSTIESSDEVLQRFQRSIYAGQIMMNALEHDIAKATPRTGTFRRRANLVWNRSAFQEHQSRIRDQNAALQLLLQVLSMPRKEDRLEAMSVKEIVFRQVDESVLSIVPTRVSSQLSSRLSVLGSDISSSRTRRSIALRYLPFDFENDLFTSYVYKRNYRSHITKRLISTRPEGLQAERRPAAISNVISTDNDGRKVEDHKLLNESTRSDFDWLDALGISQRRGIDKVDGNDLDSDKAKRTATHIQRQQYLEALSEIKNGVDMLLFFQPSSPIKELLISFFWYIWGRDREFFKTILERIAYSTGEPWVRHFKDVFLKMRPKKLKSTKPDLFYWSHAQAAGRFFDGSRQLYEHAASAPAALQLCCAAENYAVAEYLIKIGLRPQEGEEYKHPILLAHISGNHEMETLISDRITIPPDIFTVALLSLFSCPKDSIFWCQDKTPKRMDLDVALIIFLQHGANTSAMVWYHYKYVPLLHAVIYTIHCNKTNISRFENLLGHLIKNGADADELGETYWSKMRMSPLALAAALDEKTIFRTLLQEGAKVFWWAPQPEKTGSLIIPVDSTLEEKVIERLDLWCAPLLDLSTQRSLKGICVTVLPVGVWPAKFSSVQHQVQDSLEQCKQMVIPPSDVASYKTRDRFRLTMYDELFAKDATYGAEQGGLRKELEHDIGIMRKGKIHEHGNSALMVEFLRKDSFEKALACMRIGADVAYAFHSQASVPIQKIILFFRFLVSEDTTLSGVAMRRIAFGTRPSWVSLLRICIRACQPSSCDDRNTDSLTSAKESEDCVEILKRTYSASSFAEMLRRSPDTQPYCATAMQTAVAAKDYEVLEYLLSAGYTAIPVEGRESPIVVSALTLSAPLLELLLSTLPTTLKAAAATEALRELIAQKSSLTENHALLARIGHEQPLSDNGVLEILRILLQAGGDVSSSILFQSDEHPGFRLHLDRSEYPLLHLIIHAADTNSEKRLEMVHLLLDHGADPNSTGSFPFEEFSYILEGSTVSALGLATLLTHREVIDVLLNRGAKLFWGEPHTVVKYIQNTAGELYAEICSRADSGADKKSIYGDSHV